MNTSEYLQRIAAVVEAAESIVAREKETGRRVGSYSSYMERLRRAVRQLQEVCN